MIHLHSTRGEKNHLFIMSKLFQVTGWYSIHRTPNSIKNSVICLVPLQIVGSRTIERTTDQIDSKGQKI